MFLSGNILWHDSSSKQTGISIYDLGGGAFAASQGEGEITPSPLKKPLNKGLSGRDEGMQLRKRGEPKQIGEKEIEKEKNFRRRRWGDKCSKDVDLPRRRGLGIGVTLPKREVQVWLASWWRRGNACSVIPPSEKEKNAFIYTNKRLILSVSPTGVPP